MSMDPAQLAPCLDQLLSEMSPPTELIDANARANLLTWLTLVEQWNRKLDLTAARTTQELVDLLVADAVRLASMATAGSSWIDVGTGCGAPGMGLALLRPDIAMTLVEPLEKRVTFLRTVIGTLRRTDIKIVRGKGEDIAAKQETFDVAVSRATLNPPEWLALGDQLAPKGEVLVLLARVDTPTHSARKLVEEVSYTWPLTRADRRIARFMPTT
ncbi:MAG: 16S rRNA (guanine(527)-N(7))-methyltransferase RsmG [Polyangiaceae bacterium]